MDEAPSYVNIAVQGCCHGELDTIYESIAEMEQRTQQRVDLLLICGDMQCLRHTQDLQSLAVPHKYRRLNTFPEYLTGQRVAPVPTVFIGGNHEASNLLQSLCLGGYVAPNIYFLGFSGVVRFKGLRIAGLSGIFNERHYRLGRFESPPYTEDALRSVYHLRELEVHRMLHLLHGREKDPVDVFLSHDWPSDVWHAGDCARLLRTKPYFAEDMRSGKLGSPPLRQILHALQPEFWFAAHLHVKFAAVVAHQPSSHNAETTPAPPVQKVVNSEEIDLDEEVVYVPEPASSQPPPPPPPTPLPRVTRFLALDKVIPGRSFLQFLQIPVQRNECQDDALHFDSEWMAILKSTHHLLSTRHAVQNMPATIPPVTPEMKNEVADCLKREYGENLVIPNIEPNPHIFTTCTPTPFLEGNTQTDRLLRALSLPHVWTVPAMTEAPPTLATPPPDNITVHDPNEIDI